MSENMQHTILRFAVVFLFIAIGFVVVILRIFSLQYVHREELEKKVTQRDSVYKDIKAIRGNIYDAENRLLATSVPQYYLFIDTRQSSLRQNNGKTFYKYLDSIATGLSEILGDQTPSEYRERMIRSYKSYDEKNQKPGSYTRLSKKKVTYQQMKRIEQLPLIRQGVMTSGIRGELLNERMKPFGSLGSRTIGVVSLKDGNATAGLELLLDKHLTGKDGRGIRTRIAGRWEIATIKDPIHGGDVYTTLDANLLDICERPLRERLEYQEADWGCVILMEVKTGEIKAMCNLDRASDGSYYESLNHAVWRVEPGSTFKTASVMAALDDGKIEMTDTFHVYKQGWKYYNALHTDAHAADTIYNVADAMAVSSNIALAKIVTRSYNGSANKYVRALSKLGLCDSIDYIIPGAHQAIIKVPNDTVTISKMAYGYSVELSPLQMLLFYNGIANDGKMISPVLVKRIVKGNEVIQEWESQTIRNKMCDSETLANIRYCLEQVVWNDQLGTASVTPWGTKKAQSDKVKIAGKTGTAQVMVNNKHSKNKLHRMSFVGYFPADDPIYSCICVIENPRKAHDSGMDCGSVVRQIAESTMVYSGEYVIGKDGNISLQIRNED